MTHLIKKTPQGTEYRILTACRLCGGALRMVLDLGETPLANELKSTARESIEQERFPLFMSQCEACEHVQMPVIVDPERLFGHYPYVSGTSPVFVQHLKQLAIDNAVKDGELVVEIGSNDGTLLKFFQVLGAKVLGVDPAANIAAQANADLVPTITSFFTEKVATELVEDLGQAKLILALNVFAHAEDLHEIVRGVKRLLAPGGRFIFEVGYLFDMLDSGAFDLCYHEHLSFHHVRPLLGFFRKHGLVVTDVIRVGTQGGSIRVTVEHEGEVNAEVWAREWTDGEPTPDLEAFARKVQQVRGRTMSLLHDLEVSCHIAGYGAPAKLCTFASYCHLDGELNYVVDDNPLKHGKYVPGTGIQIVSPSRLKERAPSYVLVSGWNFADSIIERAGEVPWHWLVPLPVFRIV